MKNISRDATDIKSTIRSAEQLGDELLVTISALKTKMLTARSNPKVAPHEGQKALLRLQNAENQILSGMSNLFRTHDELSSIAIRMDVEHPSEPSALGSEEISLEATAA